MGTIPAHCKFPSGHISCGIGPQIDGVPDIRQPADSEEGGSMRSRVAVVSLLLVAVFCTGAVATSGIGARARRQWAVVDLQEPTLIGSTIVQGPVLITHDDSKMVRGEPCTTVQLFEPGHGPTEEIATFHCIPIARNVAHAFTVRTRPNAEMGFGCVLTEYQFAGDSEGHGVPPPVFTP
jgi:hypothetical protein